MADVLLPNFGSTSGDVNRRLRDMGDGSYAEVVALAVSPTIDIGKVELLGDDGAVIAGSSGDAASATGSWTAIWKYIAAVLGISTGAAVVTDANGTIQQYLRGLVKLIAAKITVGIDQTAPGTTDHVTGSGFFILGSATLALRANATAYTSGKIIAQSATANQCSGLALAVGRIVNGTGMVRKLRLKINSVTWLNAVVRVHLFKDTPTFTNADAGTFAAGLTESSYLGYADVTLDQSFSDPLVKGTAGPAVGSEWNFDCSTGTQNIFAVFEARSTVTADASSKTFTLTAETLAN